MTGTRLLVQTIIVAEILLLTAWGLWYGLCIKGDGLCLPFMSQRGREILEQANDDGLADPRVAAPTPQPLQLTLQIEESSIDWRKWSISMNDWMDEVQFADWPCWSTISTDVQVRALSQLNYQQYNSNMNAQNQNNILGQRHFKSIKPKSKSGLEVILYVTKTPTLVEGSKKHSGPSKSVVINDRLMIIFLSRDDNLKEAMKNLVPFLANHGIDLRARDVWQQVSISTFAKARDLLFSLRQKWLSLDPDVLLPKSLVMQWLAILEQLRQISRSKRETWSTSELQDLIQQLIDLDSHAATMPPLLMPIQHIFATFAPLLFPLLVPSLASLFREYKRYKGRLKEKRATASEGGVKKTKLD